MNSVLKILTFLLALMVTHVEANERVSLVSGFLGHSPGLDQVSPGSKLIPYTADIECGNTTKIVGHSWGADKAVKIALQCGGVKTLVLIDPMSSLENLARRAGLRVLIITPDADEFYRGNLAEESLRSMATLPRGWKVSRKDCRNVGHAYMTADPCVQKLARNF